MKINTDKHQLTRKELLVYVTYDPATGDMVRIMTRKGCRRGEIRECNAPVIGTNNRGYRWLKLFGYMYLVHRLAFLVMTGKHPTGEIDHINGDRLDNKWENLREVDALSNSRNQGIRKDCTSGVRGVDYSRDVRKWKARISHHGVRYSLGYFEKFEDAVAARRKAEIDYGYHENHARRESWKYK